MEDYLKIIIFIIIFLIIIGIAFIIFGSNQEEQNEHYGKSSSKKSHNSTYKEIKPNSHLNQINNSNNEALRNYNNYINTGIGNNVKVNGIVNNSLVTNQLTSLLKGFYNNKPTNSATNANAIKPNVSFCR